MNDVSARRRRLGLVLFGGAAIALPLTASISYAADAPAAVEETAVAPSAASAEAAGPVEKQVRVFKLVREDGDEAAATDDNPAGEKRVIRIQRRDDKDGEARVFEWNSDQPLSEEQRKRFEDMARRFDGRDLEDFARRNEQFAMRSEEFAKEHEEMARHFAELQKTMPLVSTDCDAAGSEGKREWTDEAGRKHVVVCQRSILANAALGLRAARNAIANNRDISAEVRDDVLEELDAEIMRIEEQQG